MSCEKIVITPDWISVAESLEASPEFLDWLRAEPRTFGELLRHHARWFSWANVRQLVPLNFAKMDLYRANLRGARLHDIFLLEANLEQADLFGARLNRACLHGANLRDAYLNDADLSEADLSFADLRGARLQDAIFAGADLRGADVRYTCLENRKEESGGIT